MNTQPIPTHRKPTESFDVEAFRHRVAHALTTYDRGQSTRRSYNPNALAAYLRCTDKGAPCATVEAAREAIAASFCTESPMWKIVQRTV